jgi:hypothetical protein
MSTRKIRNSAVKTSVKPRAKRTSVSMEHPVVRLAGKPPRIAD